MRLVVILFALLLISGCLLGPKQNIRLTSQVMPAKVAITSPEEIQIEAHATNVGSSQETISADITNTEGLTVIKPNRTVFTLKNGESRTITFLASLEKDAVPGNYIIDIQIKTAAGEVVWDRAKVTVVQEKGFL